MGRGRLSIFRIKNQAPLWRVVTHAISVFFENDLNTSAAAISYFVMLLLFPLLVLMLSLSQTLVGGEEFRHFLIAQVLAVLPGTHEEVRKNLESLEQVAGGAMLSCAILVFWASTWAFTVVERAHSRIWMAPPRSFLHGRLLTTGMVLASGAILLSSALGTAGVALLQAAVERIPLIHMHDDMVPVMSYAWRVVFAVTSLLVTIFIFMLIYKMMPNTQVYWIEAVPGAIISGTTWECLKYLFANALPWMLDEYRVLYGTIWLALVLMTWIYISSIVMLYGAQVTALLHCERVFARDSTSNSVDVARDVSAVG
jgi:membrane protein